MNAKGMANSAAETLEEYGRYEYESGARVDGRFPKLTKKEALKQLHDEVIEGLPERKLYLGGSPGYTKEMDLQNIGYNQCLDDVIKFIDEYFKGAV